MKKIIATIFTVLFPVLVFAQTSQLTTGNNTNTVLNPTPTTNTVVIETSSFKAFVDSVVRIASNTVVPLLITAGVLMFVWSVSKFVLKANDPKERAKARIYMLWSIIGLTLVFSIWGVAALLRNTFFGPSGNLLPQFPEEKTQKVQ